MDGEGHIAWQPTAGGGHGAWYFVAYNNDRASLDHCKLITGSGSVREKKWQGSKNQQWLWQAHRQREIKDIADQILPFLVTKKSNVEKFLDWFKDIEG